MLGWITPTYKYYDCPDSIHTRILCSILEVVSVQDVSTILSEISEIYRQCRKTAIESGHINTDWESYVTAREDFPSRLRIALLNNSFIEVTSVDDLIYFHGTPQALRNKSLFCLKLAEKHDKFIKFEIFS